MGITKIGDRDSEFAPDIIWAQVVISVQCDREWKMAVIRVQVVGMTRIEGVARATGRPYLIRRAECIAQVDGGTYACQATIPNEMADLRPGVYDIEVAPYIDRERRLQFAIRSYVPVSTTPAKAA